MPTSGGDNSPWRCIFGDGVEMRMLWKEETNCRLAAATSLRRCRCKIWIGNAFVHRQKEKRGGGVHRKDVRKMGPGIKGKEWC